MIFSDGESRDPPLSMLSLREELQHDPMADCYSPGTCLVGWCVVEQQWSRELHLVGSTK